MDTDTENAALRAIIEVTIDSFEKLAESATRKAELLQEMLADPLKYVEETGDEETGVNHG